jgi:hypothetical protein
MNQLAAMPCNRSVPVPSAPLHSPVHAARHVQAVQALEMELREKDALIGKHMANISRWSRSDLSADAR